MGIVTRALAESLTAPDAPPFSTRRGDDWVVYVDESPTASDAFAYSVARGLSSHPRWLHCRYLYDARGSELFTRITRQPEYYLTRAEEEILASQAGPIREAVGHLPIMELGAGTAAKTRRLLDVWREDGAVEYLALDIDPSVLTETVRALAAEYPGMSTAGLATSYERGLELVRPHEPMCLLFLGSSIGNFNPAETDGFLARLERSLSDGDVFLLGVDLVKNVDALEAAYNDSAGVSSAFTRNLFARMNREVGSDIDPETIDHVAYWNDRLERIEIYARFSRESVIELPSIHRSFRIAEGEMVLTEISRKYRIEKIEADLARFGFGLEHAFTDSDQRFALLLSRRRKPSSRPPPWAALAADLNAARSRTLGLVDSLTNEDLSRQVTPILSPIGWDLIHMAEFEELWLLRALEEAADDRRSLPSEYDAIETPRSVRGDIALPSRKKIGQRLRDVRRRAIENLRHADLGGGDPLLEGGFVYRMITQHEYQHQETILQAIALMDEIVYEPAYGTSVRRSILRPDTEMVLIASGPFTMGASDLIAAYDNERPARWIDVEAFWLDTAPVTNAAYLRFIERGGYDRPEWWSDEGWSWRKKHDIEHPAAWRSTESGWETWAFGRAEPVIPTSPVQHVSWFEADAYARSNGKRLPTEIEWEKAAAWDPEARVSRVYPWGFEPPGDDLANLAGDSFAPSPVGAYPEGRSFYGCHQMLGDVWEWTSSEFEPYPGFRAFPYPEYSEAHFGQGYRVLRGGSWATAPYVARNTFRNWDLPERRQIFAGFRCARDA